MIKYILGRIKCIIVGHKAIFEQDIAWPLEAQISCKKCGKWLG